MNSPRNESRYYNGASLSPSLSRKQASANEVIAKVCLGEGTAKINYGEMARRSRFNVRLLLYFQPYPCARVRDPTPFHHRGEEESCKEANKFLAQRIATFIAN